MALKHVVWDNHAILELYDEELFHLKLTILLTKTPIYRIVTKYVKFLYLTNPNNYKSCSKKAHSGLFFQNP